MKKAGDNVIRVRIKTSQEQENQGRLQVINSTVEGSSHSPKAVGSPATNERLDFYEKTADAKQALKDDHCLCNDDFSHMSLRLRPAADGDEAESRAGS